MGEFIGLTLDKVLLIGVLAALLLGNRLPEYTQKFAQFVRKVREYAGGAKDKLKEEMGPEFENVDWRQYDPRRYDPRKIVRDVLLEDDTTPAQTQAAGSPAAAAAAAAVGTMTATATASDEPEEIPLGVKSTPSWASRFEAALTPTPFDDDAT